MYVQYLARRLDPLGEEHAAIKDGVVGAEFLGARVISLVPAEKEEIKSNLSFFPSVTNALQ